MAHKSGVTISYHSSGQNNLHVKTSTGETSIKNFNSNDNREYTIKNKDGSVMKKTGSDSSYKKVK